MIKLFGIVFTILLFIGCSGLTRTTKQSSEISTSPNFNLNKYKRITVLPFNTAKPEKYNLVVSDKLSTSFMKLGYTVVERTQLQSVLKELKLEIAGLTQKDMQRLGKFLNIDAIIMGSLEYEKIEGEGGYWWLRAGTMRMIDITTGELVMSIYSNAYNQDIEFVANDIINLIKKETN